MHATPSDLFTANACKHLTRCSPSFVAFAFLRSRTCALCKAPFKGCVSEIGVYAHPWCARQICFPTVYCSSLSARAVARMEETDARLAPVMVRARRRDVCRDVARALGLRKMSVGGYDKHIGRYEYTAAPVGPHVPMLARAETLLGAATHDDAEIADAVDEHELEHVVERMVVALESEERKRKADELSARREQKARKRRKAFEASVGPASENRRPLPCGAPTFDEWRERMLDLGDDPLRTDPRIRSFFGSATLGGPSLAAVHAAVAEFDASARRSAAERLRRNDLDAELARRRVVEHRRDDMPECASLYAAYVRDGTLRGERTTAAEVAADIHATVSPLEAHVKAVRAFARAKDAGGDRLRLPPEACNVRRRRLHELAKSLGLRSESAGGGKARCVVVSRPKQ